MAWRWSLLSVLLDLSLRRGTGPAWGGSVPSLPRAGAPAPALPPAGPLNFRPLCSVPGRAGRPRQPGGALDPPLILSPLGYRSPLYLPPPGRAVPPMTLTPPLGWCPYTPLAKQRTTAAQDTAAASSHPAAGGCCLFGCAPHVYGSWSADPMTKVPSIPRFLYRTRRAAPLIICHGSPEAWIALFQRARAQGHSKR